MSLEYVEKDALFECTEVFRRNWDSPKKKNVNQGGTSSTKTYSIMQCIYQHARTDPGCVCTVTSEDIPGLKKGAYRDAENIYKGSPTLQAEVLSWNKTDRIIAFRNGSIIEFTSSDSIVDAQQGKRDYLFINEANSIEYQIYWQLAIRTKKKIYLDYNPSAPFWVHDKLLGAPDVMFLISDHRCNPFISKEMHDEIENEKDPELHRVYARGKTGNLQGIIYPNWGIIEDDLFQSMLESSEKPFIGGIDYGYSNDPTAGIQMIRLGDNVYVHELFYEPGLAAKEIHHLFKSNGFESTNPIYSEHDPDMINGINRLRNIRVIAAKKGQGSLRAGILHLQKYKVFVTRSSKNILNERKRYVWLSDPITGQPINEPIDKWNHSLDAIRYAHYTHFYRGGEGNK